MKQSEAIKYYSRKEISNFIAQVCQDREVAVKMQNSFSKRPQIIQFPKDIISFAREGGSSFHISQERWSDPLKLSEQLNQKQMDTLRIGWDFIIDIDCPDFKISTLAAEALIELLKNYKIKPQLKFSGNKGWHLCIPFEAFPSGSEKEFPKMSNILITFLKKEVLPIFINQLSENEFDLNKFIKEHNLNKEQYLKNGKIDVEKLLGLDIQLATPRHLIRSPYSLHEKSGLVSVVINPEEIKNFTKEQAKPENIKKINPNFMKPEKYDLTKLLINAKDWYFSEHRETPKNKETKKFIEYHDKIPEEFFPPCIKKIFEGLVDGKKRALFILLNFLQKAKWSWPEIEAKLKEWNSKNAQPLKTGYIRSQINWHRAQKKTISPPNCSLEQYYKDIGVCVPDNICAKIKNPLTYPKIKRQFYNPVNKNK